MMLCLDNSKAAAYDYLINYMTGYADFDLEINAAKRLTPRMCDATFSYRLVITDQQGAYALSNTTLAEDNIVVEGYTIPSWNQQNITTAGNFLPVSSNLRNEVRSAAAFSVPRLLRLVDIQRGVAVPYSLS